MPPEELAKHHPSIHRPTTDAELAEFFWLTLGLRFPSQSVCPGHSNPFAAICDAFFARSPVVVWKASRAFGGKTNAMGALAFAEAVTLRASVSLLGGSGEQATRVHEYLQDFWRLPSAPTGLLRSDPSGRRTTLVWGNKVNALMASMAAVSGPHPQRLRIDEVDLVDLKLLDQALGQPMDKDDVEKNVVLSSAHYEADGTLTEVLKRAKEKGWIIHEWCYRECLEPYGWLRTREVETTRQIVTKAMWDVQYDLQEPSPEGRAIDPAEVEKMFVGAPVFADVGGGEFPYREFEPPVVGASYGSGGDWARSRDYVEIATLRFDVTPIRLVAYQRFRKKATQYTLAAFQKQNTRYPGRAAHDATSLGGQMMVDLIDIDATTQVEGVTMVGNVRRELFTDLIVGIERGELRAPRIDVLYRQFKFCRNVDLWGEGHAPDGFVAMSMAYKATQAAELGLAGALPVAADVVEQQAQGIQSMLSFLGGNGNGSNGGNGAHE